jgi:very-short-patch-repair endonuclease
VSARRQVSHLVLERGWQSGSDIEDRAALFLSRARWSPEVVRQQWRVGPYRLDFAWPLIHLALEVDGPRHLFDPQTARKDAERDAYLRSQGWLVLRVDAADDPGSLEEQLVRVSQVAYALTRDAPITRQRWSGLGDQL